MRKESNCVLFLLSINICKSQETLLTEQEGDKDLNFDAFLKQKTVLVVKHSDSGGIIWLSVQAHGPYAKGIFQSDC